MNNSKSWKTRFWNWLGLTNEVTIKVYHGYGYKEKVIVHGHVLLFSPLPRKKYRKSVIRNTFALFRLFLVKPYKNATVNLEHSGQRIQPFQKMTASLSVNGRMNMQLKKDGMKYRRQLQKTIRSLHKQLAKSFILTLLNMDLFLI